MHSVSEALGELLTTLHGAQIDLANNQLCGLDANGDGTYTAEGIKTIASAISISASLTRIDLRNNQLGYQGAMHIAKSIAVRRVVMHFCSEFM